ncbi:hypothetical protein EJB05_37091, partial [Eragrostis curvula]
MALHKTEDARLLFVVAITVIALVMSPCPVQGDPTCDRMPGCTPNKCRQHCIENDDGNLRDTKCWTDVQNFLDCCCDYDD